MPWVEEPRVIKPPHSWNQVIDSSCAGVIFAHRVQANLPEVDEGMPWVEFR